MRAEQLVSDLAKETSPESQKLRELLVLQYEITKEKLVDATDMEIIKLQGEARFIDRFIKQLTRPAPPVRQEGLQ